jgi:hypothetical protein
MAGMSLKELVNKTVMGWLEVADDVLSDSPASI